jgi:hypothetical protein
MLISKWKPCSPISHSSEICHRFLSVASRSDGQDRKSNIGFRPNANWNVITESKFSIAPWGGIIYFHSRLDELVATRPLSWGKVGRGCSLPGRLGIPRARGKPPSRFCGRTASSASLMCAVSHAQGTTRSSTEIPCAQSCGPRGSATCTCESSEACATRDAILRTWPGAILRFAGSPITCRPRNSTAG